MGRKRWAALVAAAAVGLGLAFGRPHKVTAAPAAPLKTESEIRSLDIEFYEKRIAEDTLSASDRSR